MFFKKFAMLILTIGMATGFAMTQPVSVAAEEKNEVSIENPVDVTGDNGQDEEITATAQPVVSATPKTTPVVKSNPCITKTPARSNGVKKIVSSKEAKKKKTTKKKYTKAQLRLMASIINCEAGGESFQGQVAVGIVVMNRVKSKGFPNTIKGVIYQRGQFSPVRNGMLHKKLKQYDAGKIKSKQWKSCIKAAKKALGGQSTVKIKGKTRSMKGVRFFSVGLSGAKFRLGGHRFK